MKEIKVIIGKNFGDEGKGVAVHGKCKNKNAVVVRHNGGAQAGHTVFDGIFHHVFHQLGSGTYAGAATFWNSTFLPDLFKLDEEFNSYWDALEKAGVGSKYKPVLYAHPDCAPTIIYDVLLNSLVETLRSGKKHGSCGMGIYEAVCRTRNDAYSIRMRDFLNEDSDAIAKKLFVIREEYVRKRLKEIEAEYGEICNKPEAKQWIELIDDDNVIRNVAETMYANFHQFVTVEKWETIAAKYETVVFENSQGLMLDMDNRAYFPHLTPSHTGMFNVVNMMQALECKDSAIPLEINYVTRTYVTRHGAGRLDYECDKEEINPILFDTTNLPNFWQGSLRYAKHPKKEEFFGEIIKDVQLAESSGIFTRIEKNILVNHLDETKHKVVLADEEMDCETFRSFCLNYGFDVQYYLDKPLSRML